MKLMFSILVVFIFFPAEICFAWAPGTHLFFANEVFRCLHLFPNPLQTLLTQYRLDFLYGCIAADITIGKAYVEYLYNCHNFNVGLGLLDKARSADQQAFVLGYLSHLAADTVSHNYFVPYQNLVHYKESRLFRHAYWEVRLDQYLGQKVWDHIGEIIDNPRNHSHDELLDGALKDTIFSFKTNRILFSSMLAIQRLKKWQGLIHRVNKKSLLQFEIVEIEEYNQLALTGIVLFLRDQRNSPVYQVDPTGKDVMDETRALIAHFRRSEKTGHFGKEIHLKRCEQFRDDIRRRLFSEYRIDNHEFTPQISLP